MTAKKFLAKLLILFLNVTVLFGFGGFSTALATTNTTTTACTNEVGWYTTYYNYPSTNIGMNLPGNEWYNDYGDPMSVGGPWVANWYNDTFKRFTTVESDLMFGSSFFPFDSAPEEITTRGHDYYFGLKAEAKVTALANGSYAYNMSSDDDVWIYVNGAMIVDNSGVHPASSQSGTFTLNQGENSIVLFFAERHIVESELNFEFTDTSLVVKPTLCVDGNHTPVAVNSNITTNEDTAKSSTLVATDSDVPANTLTYTITVNPTHGTISGFNATTGAYTYTPNTDYNGADSFKWKANDGTVNSNEATVSITVNPVDEDNQLPVLGDIEDKTVDELVNLSFTATATDPDLDTLTFSLGSGAPAGATIDPTTGVFSFTPTEAQGPGVYPVTVIVTDSKGATDSDTFNITVNEVNVAPIAQDGNTSTHVNTPVSVNMIGSDTDIPANTLTFIIVGTPANGTLSTVTGNTVTYTPNTDFIGTDTFTFKVNDGTADSDVKTFTISVDNSAPELTDVPTNGEDNKVIIDEEVNYTFDANATDPDLDTLTFSLGVGAPSGVTIDPTTGVFSWTPTETQGPGDYMVTVIVSDGLLSDTQTFSIHVNEVNIAPTATDSSITTDEDTAKSGALSATDVDVPANTLTYTITVNPTHGTISGFNATTGAYTYTPNTDYNGADSFKWKANDGTVNSNEATVSITVNPVNDLPAITLTGNPTVNIVTGTTFTDPGAVCTDLEDGTLTPVVVNGGFDKDTVGSYTFTYTCTDSNNASVSTTRTLVVSNTPSTPNTAPVITLNGDSTMTITRNTNFTDPGAMCTDAEDGTLTTTVNKGGFDEDTTGIYTFTYSCVDSKGLAAPTVTRTVTIQNPPSGGGGGGGGIVNRGHAIPVNMNPQPTPVPVGQVLGASTSCGIYVEKYLRVGYKGNNRDAVIKVQKFLNDYENARLSVDGVFGTNTEKALKLFQKKYEQDVLMPWNIATPTGIFYLTTQTKVNNIMCPELNLPIPTDLKQYSNHPETPKS